MIQQWHDGNLVGSFSPETCNQVAAHLKRMGYYVKLFQDIDVMVIFSPEYIKQEVA